MICSFERTIIGKCPPGLLYSTDTGICDFAYNVPGCTAVESRYAETSLGSDNDEPRHIKPKTIRPAKRQPSRGQATRQEKRKPVRPAPSPPAPRPAVRQRPAPPKEDTSMLHSVHMDLPNPLTVNVIPSHQGRETELIGDSK